MIIRITLPLNRKFGKDEQEWPSHEDIQSVLRSLGTSLTPKLNETESREYITEKIEPGKSVQLYSTFHYQDLAIKNMGKDPEASFCNEIRDKSIYFGAHSEMQTQITVTRENDGEIALMLSNERAKRALVTLEEILSDILNSKLVDRKRSFGRNVQLHTTKKNSHVLNGQLLEKRLLRSFSLNRVESGLIILSTIIFLVSYSLDTSFVASADDNGIVVDPLPDQLRKLGSIWPFALVAVASNLLTIIIKHLFAKREQVNISK